MAETATIRFEAAIREVAARVVFIAVRAVVLGVGGVIILAIIIVAVWGVRARRMTEAAADGGKATIRKIAARAIIFVLGILVAPGLRLPMCAVQMRLKRYRFINIGLHRGGIG
jgi:hypothetical protein